MKKYFIALEPEKRLVDLVLDQKKNIRKSVGEQKYLSESPHLTLFLITLNNKKDEKNVLSKLEEITSSILLPLVNLNHLKIFKNDIQTNGHTMAYQFSKRDIKLLKKIQFEVIKRTVSISTKQFFENKKEIYESMSEIERKNTDDYGFPFIGENWIPHITIGSIEKEKFNYVYSNIQRNQIRGKFYLPVLSLYKISKPPVLVGRFKFKD